MKMLSYCSAPPGDNKCAQEYKLGRNFSKVAFKDIKLISTKKTTADFYV